MPLRTHSTLENLAGMRISVDEPSALSTWTRGGESWRVSEGKMRKIDGAAAVRARPGDESVACAYLDLVAAAKLGDHANLVALRELGQRLVHQVSHVLASPAHRGSAHGEGAFRCDSVW